MAEAPGLFTTRDARDRREWARLLASVGINSLAPQDVNCKYRQTIATCESGYISDILVVFCRV